MSYDFSGGDREPYFDDTHPAFSMDGIAGTVMMTATGGYARCGNYTSNVSGMWAKCLTAALDAVPTARRWIDADAIAFNASGRTCSRLIDGEWQRDVGMPLTGDLRLRDLNGLRMGDIAPVLHAAVAWGVEHIDVLREDNPDNGWGNAEGAVTYLWDLARYCDEYPDSDLYISS